MWQSPLSYFPLLFLYLFYQIIHIINFNFYRSHFYYYRGTFSKTSRIVNGRRPFEKDHTIFNYDFDSEGEWEEGDGEGNFFIYFFLLSMYHSNFFLIFSITKRIWTFFFVTFLPSVFRNICVQLISKFRVYGFLSPRDPISQYYIDKW